jgi:hypothetical protein
MRNLAIIEKGIVKNIIVISDGEKGDTEIGARSGVEITGLNVKIGWSYDGKEFIEPELTERQLQSNAQEKAKEAARQSGLDKLEALGLTPEEILAITGA